MAITGIIGLPGHGKSYSAVEIAILPALSEGRAVYTNIPLRLDVIQADFPGARVFPVELNEQNCANPQFWEFEPGALICLDELWRVWPSGLKANQIPEFQLSFIKEHRHRTDSEGRWQDIVLVSQMLTDMPSIIYGNVETTVYCLQMTELGLNDRFVREYYRGAIQKYTTKKEQFINNERCQYHEKVFRYYRSATKGVGDAGPKGGKIVKQSLLRSWRFQAGAAVVALAFLVSGLSGRQAVGTIDDMKKAKVAASPEPSPTVVAQATPVPQPVVKNQPPPEPVESERWRLAGAHGSGADRRFLITDGKHSRWLSAAKCHRDDLDDVCVVRGELITSWTGPARNGGRWLPREIERGLESKRSESSAIEPGVEFSMAPPTHTVSVDRR
ncbi:MAG: zonular occludens toxin domain-containing protein [Methylomonas sp.]|nr:zonular occludens toxin domain-containing protein [Methylomonas sp.]